MEYCDDEGGGGGGGDDDDGDDNDNDNDGDDGDGDVVDDDDDDDDDDGGGGGDDDDGDDDDDGGGGDGDDSDDSDHLFCPSYLRFVRRSVINPNSLDARILQDFCGQFGWMLPVVVQMVIRDAHQIESCGPSEHRSNNAPDHSSFGLNALTPWKYVFDITSIGQRSSPWTWNSVKVELKCHLMHQAPFSLCTSTYDCDKCI